MRLVINNDSLSGNQKWFNASRNSFSHRLSSMEKSFKIQLSI